MSAARIAEQIVTPVIPESIVPAHDYNIATSRSAGLNANSSTSGFGSLECLVELRAEDPATSIQFRECLIDYTRCPNQKCIKKLM